MRRFAPFAASVILLGVLGPSIVSRVGADAPTYSVEDLATTPDGVVPSVTGINHDGQASGTASTPDGQKPVLYSNGQGFAYLAGFSVITATGTAVNAHGDVTGTASTPSGMRAYRYSAGAPVFIDPPSGGSFTQGTGINVDGVVTGATTAPAARSYRAAVGQTIEVLPALGTSTTIGFGINDAGQVTGTSVTANGVQHAFRANADGTIEDLGAFTATGASIGNAIDASGIVVGRAVTAAGVFHAFRSTSTGIEDIDTVGSSFSNATAVSGDVTVGMMQAADGSNHAFMHTHRDGMIDLNTRIPADSGWVLMTATGVNDKGQIVGMGTLNGETRAYRLTPDRAPDTTAPSITDVTATPSSIFPPNGAATAVSVVVSATDDSGETPTCTLTSVASTGQPSDASITGDLTASVLAIGGRTYTLTATCVDRAGNASAAATAVVVPPDTTAPAITAISATPPVIATPNGEMVPVNVAVKATDDVDAAPSCALQSVTGAGTDSDHVVTGPMSGAVRAVGGRTYSFTVSCRDRAGNHREASTPVMVAADKTAPTFTTLSGSPDTLWPANGKMVRVTVSASAVDDVDANVGCGITSVTANAPADGDAVIVGPFSADLRAERNDNGTTRVYAVHVTCRDSAGNAATDAVTVTVGKSPLKYSKTMAVHYMLARMYWRHNHK